METKHTKGPWKAVSALASVEFNCMEIAEVAYMRVVPECGGWPQQGTPEEDARLIAAAPELLEALKSLVQLEADGKHADECAIEAWERAAATASKAEGR